jgi:hypothetical protein
VLEPRQVCLCRGDPVTANGLLGLAPMPGGRPPHGSVAVLRILEAEVLTHPWMS